MDVEIIHERLRNLKAQGMIDRVNQTVKSLLGKVLYNEESLRWIDYYDKIVYKYIISMHRTTNKFPFLLFIGKPSFNPPALVPEINEDRELLIKNRLVN